MSIPAVVIAGRPNVGKSSLFNFMLGRRVAIVEPTAGVTRDRITAVTTYEDRSIEFVDTGGMGVEDIDLLTDEVEHQIQVALEKADLILFVTDVMQGVLPKDKEIADRLRRLDKPIILVANKADARHIEQGKSDFFALGLGEPILTSAVQSSGYHDVMDAIIEKLPEAGPAPQAEEEPVTFAIVGKRNVGKSTFINALVQEERVIVSEKPGTTRDAVDVYFEKGGKTYIAIDTAGLRRRSQMKHAIEFFSFTRAEAAIRRAMIVLFFFDATTGVSKVDKKLGMIVRDSAKACALVVNKWDLAVGKTPEEYERYFTEIMPGLSFAPMVFTSAKEGTNVGGVLDIVRELHKQSTVRVPTADLNEAIREAITRRKPSPKKNKLPKIYYATQVSVGPPTLVLFVNHPELFAASYKRYLANFLRKMLPFHEIPIRIIFRERRRSESKFARK
ncbi:MAG: ribosome biogenesis GTPase Der [Planctomycetes bacterium]|nr:ribosome biogenesis GTPase Der [Planctomycetota bacterium]